MFLDTSGLLCCHHAREPQFAPASTLFTSTSFRMTHNYVLAEFIPLSESRGLDRVKALDFAADLADNPNVTMVWVDEDLHRMSLALLQHRIDKSYSLCDAVSFVLMRMYGETEALTTDHHFEQEGFVRLLMP
jgi:predicted nucleic acid-binding protein